ncbi:MAG: group II intron reverse transcriptase/maturase [Candidatus Kapaibacterium sp.]
MEIRVNQTIPIEREWVTEAYLKLRKGGKGTGVDQESWKTFDKKLTSNLHTIWSRLASGSYHPNAVREVEIPKKDGTVRKLGIPTLRDRISQQVVKEYMENRIDRIFHQDSYGYRPLKNAHQALRTVIKNCYRYDWVIDMDISKFFDEIDHEIMLKAVSHVMPEKWVLMYVKRWLEMPIQEKDGNIRSKEGKGTPQGGVISPLLANLYLHFTLDKWFDKNHPEVRFVRYADDVVVHCKSEQQAKYILAQIMTRLGEVKLTIKESKTKIAYCKDYRRKADHEHVTFDFLGFSFKPSKMIMKDKQILLGFLGDISKDSAKKIMEEFRLNKMMKHTELEIQYIAAKLNTKLIGWINYYGLFTKRGLEKCFYHLNTRIRKWIRKKYKLGTKEALNMYQMIRKEKPNLFYHWSKGYS